MIEVKIFWDSGTETYSQFPQYYDTYQTIPRLIKISEISRTLSMNFSIENSTLKATFNNHDGYFNKKIYQNIGQKVIVKQSSVIIFTGLICDYPESGENQFSIKADTFSLLKQPVNRVLSRDVFPDIPGENEGWGNIVVGTLKNMLKAPRIGNNRFFASWTCMSSLYCFDKNGNTIQPTGWGYDTEKGYTYIDYASTDVYVFFYGMGPVLSGQLIENPASMFEYLAANFSNFEVEGILDAASIFEERIYLDNVVWINDNSDWKWLIGELSKNFNCRIYLSRDGKLKIKIIRWGVESPVMTIHPSEIKDFVSTKDTTNIRGKWQRKHQYDPLSNSYKRTPIDITGNVNSTEVGEFLQRFLNDDMTSRDVALRESFFLKNPVFKYKLSIPFKRANIIDISDTVLAKSLKSPFKTEYRQIQLLRERRSPGSGFVEFEGFDLTEITKGSFFLYEDNNPDCAVLQQVDGPTLW